MKRFYYCSYCLSIRLCAFLSFLRGGIKCSSSLVRLAPYWLSLCFLSLVSFFFERNKYVCMYVLNNFHLLHGNAQIPLHLAQNLLKTRFSTRSPTCFEQVADMSQTSQRPKKSRTCFRPDRSITIYICRALGTGPQAAAAASLF